MPGPHYAKIRGSQRFQYTARWLAHGATVIIDPSGSSIPSPGVPRQLPERVFRILRRHGEWTA
ncbi:hypothetical protein KCP69_18415 [Salmonella enterica subsp. enterica]|nr:hypothetical protein KCP69_18415 [Salmonella enterica subsp. enterica]